MGVEEDEEVGGAVALAFAVIALDLARGGGDGPADLANELGRALVEADDGPGRIGGFGVKVEHVLHAGDILGVDLGDAPHVAAPGLKVVLGQTPTHRLAREGVVLGQPDDRVGQQLQCPAGAARRWAGAGGRHQESLLPARELALGAGARLFPEGRFQIAFDEAPLGPVHRRAADPEAGGDGLVGETGMGRQQDLRPLQLARRMLAAAQQRRKRVVLGLAQLHPISYIHPDHLRR